MPITTVESLRTHLQWAIELEHATLPPYMTALYSIREGHNREAAEVITSVFLEEMLHMTLAANILNAVGGSPKLDYEGFVPSFPSPLPHSNGKVIARLNPFSPETIRDFMAIEQPAAPGGQPQDENYETIGQFYEAIAVGLRHLAEKLGEAALFCGDPSRQITEAKSDYGGAGEIIAVTNLGSALAALEEIVEQGEGSDHTSVFDGDRNMFHPEREEVAHYFRFYEILAGRLYRQGDTPESEPSGDPLPVDWDAVYPMKPNITPEDVAAHPEIKPLAEAFMQGYCDMLRRLEKAFNGEPASMGNAVGVMYQLRKVAVELLNTPLGDTGYNAGPCFAYRPAIALPAQRIMIRDDGPYLVFGEVPIRRVQRALDAEGNRIAWQTNESIGAEATCALCRCGKSKSKPFCDGSHVPENFDGTLNASLKPYAEGAEVIPGEGITARSNKTFCMHAKYCFNKETGIRKLLSDSAGPAAKTAIAAMVENCPSGTFTFALGDETAAPIEKHSPPEINLISRDAAASTSGPLWVKGGVPLFSEDGTALESRERMTLCRCGHSKNKPFCDGAHAEAGFVDESEPEA